MCTKFTERALHIEQLLLINNHEIDTNSLRKACSYGIPDLLRPLCWRLFLDFLPKERHLWPKTLRKQRADYLALVENLIVLPGQKPDAFCRPAQDGMVDHPLSSNPHSEWDKFFKDNEMLLQIDRDVRRLRPEIEFFQKNTPFPLTSAAQINLSGRITRENLPSDVVESRFVNRSFLNNNDTKLPKIDSDDPSSGNETHWQVLERILFVYSKVNSGVKYVQGMNEIIGPIYYVFATDPDLEWAEHAEVDTFYCFQHLMSEIKDNFIRTLDDSNCGIESAMNRLHERIQSHDPELYTYLIETLGIKPQFYAFHVITLWDAIFASKNRVELVEFVCMAMLSNVREILLAGDFGQNIRLLQNYPVMDVSKLIVLAYEIRSGEHNHSRTGSFRNMGSENGIKSWNNLNKERLTAFVSGAKERFTSYASATKKSLKK
uniref:Rab-GAP TBC domain-containing protein n=1 Tax=Acrobeloides nanus TaxID=290746 RepID=A0A914DR32_9BILA